MLPGTRRSSSCCRNKWKRSLGNAKGLEHQTRLGTETSGETKQSGIPNINDSLAKSPEIFRFSWRCQGGDVGQPWKVVPNLPVLNWYSNFLPTCHSWSPWIKGHVVTDRDKITSRGTLQRSAKWKKEQHLHNCILMGELFSGRCFEGMYRGIPVWFPWF